MLTLFGTSWCSDCKRAKQLLGEQRVPYEFVDIDSDEAGLAYVHEVNEGKSVIPVLRFDDGSTLVEPSNAELAAKLGLTAEAKAPSTTSSSSAAARPASPPRSTPRARASRPSSSSAPGSAGRPG
jgi:glutaredoxin-like protein